MDNVAIKDDYKWGKEFSEELSSRFNSFSNRKTIAKELMSEITDENERDRINACICLIGLKFASEWKESNGDPWDTRKLGAMKFSIDNENIFHDLLYKMVGVDLYYNTGMLSLSRCKNFRSLPKWLVGFYDCWVNVHPTLQQAAFGGLLLGYFIENEKDCPWNRESEHMLMYFI